jgi:hypothetical protein
MRDDKERDAGRHVSGQILRVDGGDQIWPA